MENQPWTSPLKKGLKNLGYVKKRDAEQPVSPKKKQKNKIPEKKMCDLRVTCPNEKERENEEVVGR